jgi:aspartate/methionine/tyrosine aminotransferase
VNARKRMAVEPASRLARTPVDFSADLRRIALRHTRGGRELIDLSNARPAGPVHPRLAERLRAGVDPIPLATPEAVVALRAKLAAWLSPRMGVRVPPSQVVLTPGVRAGLAALCQAYVESGEKVLACDPCYPAVVVAARMAGAKVVAHALKPRTDYLPNFEALPRSGIRLAVISYPHNPTGAVADRPVFEEAVRWARKSGCILVHDAAFSDLGSEGWESPSLVSVRRALAHGVEFRSFTFPYSLPGLLLGFAVGGRLIVRGLSDALSAWGFRPSAWAVELASLALDCEDAPAMVAEEWSRRRHVLSSGLPALGFRVRPARSTPFVWAKVPRPFSSVGLARKLARLGVLTMPGDTFGTQGEGHLRVGVGPSLASVREAVDRIRGAFPLRGKKTGRAK